jgi:hypothetical protein
MIDGAHLLSPGIISYAKLAFSINKNAFVTVPVYHLGPEEQNKSTLNGYNEETEQELLRKSSWKTNGYKLFEVSTICEANERGFFAPIIESNCFFATKKNFVEIGFADESFQLIGGGAINLHMIRKIGTIPGIKIFTLGGEGSFHQFHGGVTSSSTKVIHVDEFQQQLHDKWGGEFYPLAKNPIILGHFPHPSHENLQFSSKKMTRRFQVCKKKGNPVWPDDVVAKH